MLASGLPLHHGAQLAVDITIRSATTAAGLPSAKAAHTNGAVLMAARWDQEAKYSELLVTGAVLLSLVWRLAAR